MEIMATPSKTTGRSARETELESALKTALYESNKLRQRLKDTQKTQLELRRKIIQLEQQTKELRSKFDREASEHL